MRIESFGLSEYFDDRSENGKTFFRQFLRGDVFEEGERRYSRVLLRVAVRRESVIRSGGVVTASTSERIVRDDSKSKTKERKTNDSGE